jgi:hypothetical protein
MTEVTILPNGPEPTKETAHYYSQTLYEHFVAFQNQNNQNGFPIEKPTVTIELMPVEKIMALEHVSAADCLLLFAQHEYVTEKQFKEFRNFIQKKMTVPGVFRAKMCKTQEMMAHLFGYRTAAAMMAYARQHLDKKYPGLIRNFRDDIISARNALFDSYGKEQRKKKLKSSPEIKQAFREGQARTAFQNKTVPVVIKKKRKVVQQ